MKKRIHLFVTTLLLLLSNSIWSQFDDFITLDENDFRTLRMVDDEFLIDKDLYNFYQGKNLNAFEENFNFWGDSGFGGSNFAVINAGLMIEAQKRAALQDWYQKQRELIKDEIEEHYGTEFDSFEKAVDRTFVDFGKKNHRVFFNFNNNVINLRNSHLNTNKVYKSRNQINLRELHHLNYRKQEILSGNINNSIFTFSEIYGGIKLRDIRDINAINRNWNTIKGFLDVNLPTEENARYHSEGLRNLDGTFDNFMLGLQRDYYHRELNPGQRLWLEQFSINFLQATRFSNPFSGPHTINFNVPGGWSKGLSIPVGTEDVLQNYLWAHAERSVFDPNYYLNVLDEILKNNGYLPIYGDLSKLPRYTGYYYKQAAIAQANDRRNAAFNNLVDAAPSEEDIKIDLAITALGPENNKLLENNPDLRREVVEYLEVNDISQYATDGINYLFTQFRTNPEFIVNADLFKATKSSRQTASDSNLALQIGFNQQAITEGITNFGNVLAELLRDNVNPEFEGSLIRVIFAANGYNINPLLTNEWFGMGFRFVKNNGESLLIHFENGNRDYGTVKKKWYVDKDKDGYHAKGSSLLVQDFNPGGDWREGVSKGEDCDDTDATKTTDCEEGCKKTTGLLHDANFTNKTPTLGYNTTLATDNFRNDDWSINKVNCGSGKVPKGSTVNVTSTTPVVRTLSDGRKINYFKVEYDECIDNNKEKLNCGGDPCEVTSYFGKNANESSVNKCSLEKIKEIADRLGIDEFEISSTARDAKNQARIMYNNIVAYGVTKQKSLYGSNGDKVIDAYSTAKAKAGSTATTIKQAMEDKINELGPGNVSKHSADPNVLTVVDIKPSSISSSKRSKFVDAINNAVATGDVSRFLHPGNSTDPAYHIEINAKDCELKDCNK